MDEFSPESIRAQLLALADKKYCEFHRSLIPGSGKIIGVRIPQLRDVAKRLASLYRTDRSVFNCFAEYVLSGRGDTQEEIMIYGMSIGYLKADIEEVLVLLDSFMPFNTNWAINDSVCITFKIFKKNRARVLQFFESYISSGKTYYIRMAIVSLLAHFAEEEYVPYVLTVIDSLPCGEYYVSMAAAWCLSVFYVKFPHLVMPYLKSNNLDTVTYNRALQKIIESFRCPQDMKNVIRGMKKKIEGIYE